MLQGFSGQLDTWLARRAFELTTVERLDAMFSAADMPGAVIVFADAWTSRGGSQFLNSSSTGPYMDYLCDEVVPFVDDRYPVLADREHRGVVGSSSGGYGAMVVLDAAARHLRRARIASPATRCSSAPISAASRRSRGALRDEFAGSLEVFLERLAERGAVRLGAVRPTARDVRLRVLLFARSASARGRRCCRSRSRPVGSSKRCGPGGWRTTRCAWLRGHADALRGMRRIVLEAGSHDEYYLDLAAQAFADELDAAGRRAHARAVRRRPWGIRYRYPGAIRELLVALGAVTATAEEPSSASPARAHLRSASVGRGASARAGGVLPAADRGAEPAAERVPRDDGRGGTGGG